MFKVELTEQQLNNLMACLDTQLRQGGLSSLTMVVELFNVLRGVQKVDDQKAQQ